MAEYVFHRTGYDAGQLAWDIEDETDLCIGGSGSEGISVLEGYMNTGGDEIRIVTYEPDTIPAAPAGIIFRARRLTPLDEERLRQVVEGHVPRQVLYRGRLAAPVTRYARSVARVLVRNTETGEERFATGFLFERRDLLLTAAHVVTQPFELAAIEFGDLIVRGQVECHDALRDVALVTLDRNLQAPPLRIRRAIVAPADVGMDCVVMGFPDIPGMMPSPSVYELRVASIRRNYMMNQGVLELSTHLGSGCSGAPVLNDRHSLLGMVIGYPSSDHVADARYPWPKWTPIAVTCNELSAYYNVVRG